MIIIDILNNKQRLYFVFILLSVLINLLTVFIHELGHAVAYWLQGYAVILHFTHTDILNGSVNIYGAFAGVFTNILIGGIALILLLKYKSVLWFIIAIANTWFVRGMQYIIQIITRFDFRISDEEFIALYFGIKPNQITYIGLAVMSLIIIPVIVALFKVFKNYKQARNVLLLSLALSIVSFILVVELESIGI